MIYIYIMYIYIISIHKIKVQISQTLFVDCMPHMAEAKRHGRDGLLFVAGVDNLVVQCGKSLVDTHPHARYL